MEPLPLVNQNAFKLWRLLPPPLQAPEMLDLFLQGLAGALSDFSLKPSRTCGQRLIAYVINASELILYKQVSRVPSLKLQALDVDWSDIYARVWCRFFRGTKPHDDRFHSFRPLMWAYVKYSILEIVKERKNGIHSLRIDVPIREPSPDGLEKAERIRQAFTLLAPADASVIDKLGQGKKPSQIAAEANISPAAARQRIRRARRRLTDHLRDCGIMLSQESNEIILRHTTPEVTPCLSTTRMRSSNSTKASKHSLPMATYGP